MLTLDQVMGKSAARISGLHPVLQAGASALIKRSYAKGVPIILTAGMRTNAEQEALYAQGRSKPGAIVTNARGGASYHNYGLAVDFALLMPDGKMLSWDTARDGDKDQTEDWQEVVREAKRLGFEWGGDWTSFKDYPHLQMSFGLTINELRTGKRPTEQQAKEALSRMSASNNEANTEIKVNIKLNGKKLTEGVLNAGTTYAPVRVLAEALGAKVTYDAPNKTVDIVTDQADLYSV